MELHDKGHFWDIDALKAEIPEIFREISVEIPRWAGLLCCTYALFWKIALAPSSITTS